MDWCGGFEKDVVLEIDVFHQVYAQRSQSQIQRTPGIAGAGRRGEAIGEAVEAFECFAVMVMLHAHDQNQRAREGPFTASQKREQHLLLRLYVTFQRLFQHTEVIGQSTRA